MFTAGCCILCLSIKTKCVDLVKRQVANFFCRRAIRNAFANGGDNG